MYATLAKKAFMLNVLWNEQLHTGGSCKMSVLSIGLDHERWHTEELCLSLTLKNIFLESALGVS